MSMSDILLAVVISLGDLAAATIGKLIGPLQRLTPTAAHKLGTWVLAAAIVGTGIFLTLRYA
jgi:dolichol kinase